MKIERLLVLEEWIMYSWYLLLNSVFFEFVQVSAVYNSWMII